MKIVNVISMIFFLSDNDFRIRELNEDIMCAKELLTLGQNSSSKVNSLSCSLYVEEDVNKELGQVIVHVSPKNQFEINTKSPPRTFLNVDGTFSDSSDSAGESDCENVSLSLDRPASERILLNKHSGSKSTVEGSCPSALAKNPFDSVIKCKKKKRTKKKLSKSSLVRVNKNSEVKIIPDNGELMVGDCPPSSPKIKVASSSVPIPGRSPEVKNSAVESGSFVNSDRHLSQDQTGGSVVNLGSCETESGRIMNNIVSTAEGTIVTMANSVTAFSFQQGGRPATLTSVPATVCVSSINGAAGHHIVAVAGMNLGHSPPVLVFSANSSFASAGSPSGNLILGNFSGTALPMALFPGSTSAKMMSATQVSLQGGDIFKLTSGGGLNTVQSLPGGLLALPQGSFQLGTAAAGGGPVLTLNSSGAGAITTMVMTTPAPVISDSFPGDNGGGTRVLSLDPPEPVPASSSPSDPPSETPAGDTALKEMRVEPTFKEDGTVEWNCNVCFKVRNNWTRICYNYHSGSENLCS